MTEKLLRNGLKEAQEKKQLGLLIWASWRVWSDLSSDMKSGNQIYDSVLCKISKQEEATISAVWKGLYMPGALAVSVQKLSSSDQFFSEVLKFCEKENYKGPITLIPLNETFKIH